MNTLKRKNSSVKKIVGGVIVILLMLSFVATIPLLATAEETRDYTDITPEQAYNLIRHYSPEDIVILDVRNESECTFNHLFNSLQIPSYLLGALVEIYNANPNATIIDYRSIELMAHLNDPIFVYCAGGARSQIACNILAENGFTNVYNIIGGIAAWSQASLPMYYTTHEVTVETPRHIDIEPLLLTGCGCPTDGQSSNNTLQNIEVSNIVQNETFAEADISFDLNGTTVNSHVAQTTIWTYTHNTEDANATASLVSVNTTAYDLNTHHYLLKYDAQNVAYNFSLSTKLDGLNASTFNASNTLVRFIPLGKTELQSVEIVNFTSPLTLAELYESLDKSCEKLARIYHRDGVRYDDEILKNLATSYKQMADELQEVSRLVSGELHEYNNIILYSTAVMTDDACSDCQWWCQLLIGLVGCSAWDIAAGYLLCTTLAPAGGVPAFVCGAIWTAVISAVCYFGVPPYCDQLCAYGGYCTPQTFYVGGIAQTPGIYGNGVVTNAYGIVGSGNDGNYARISGTNNGAGGNIMGTMNSPAHGNIQVRARSISPVSTFVHIYIIDSSSQWILVNFMQISPNPNWQVFNFGAVNGNFQYIAIAAYNANGPSDVIIDNIKAVN